MNTIGRLIILVVSASLFFPAYAQTETDEQTAADIKKHHTTIESLTGKPVSEDVKKHSATVLGVVKAAIKQARPDISSEELNTRANAITDACIRETAPSFSPATVLTCASEKITALSPPKKP